MAPSGPLTPTALRKGESVSTPEIAKQLLESARGDRFETVELLSKPMERCWRSGGRVKRRYR